MKYHQILFVVLCLCTSFSFADGTKQLRKTSLEKSCLQLYDQDDGLGPFRKFATYEAAPTQRLYFTISDYTSEVVLFGFQLDSYSDTLYFRIKDQLDNVVYAPQRTPIAGQGYIQNYNEIIAGPDYPTYISNAGGYDPLLFTPTSNGDYYIEFNLGDPEIPTPVAKRIKHYFELFDLSVVKSGKIVEGRVWSRAWDFSTQAEDNVFSANLFIYADDGVVTSVDFNGMKPFGFVVSCNQTGTRKTYDYFTNRQSVEGDSTYPEYRIFLTYPDDNVFKTGVLSTILDIPPIVCSSDMYCVTVKTSGAGAVEVLLELNGMAGYQPGSEDILLDTNVTGPGSFCIPWNGKTGLGKEFPHNKTFQAIVTFKKGLTHLPLFDVEGNPNGYIVNLVAPEKKLLQLYWDDSQVASGSQNLEGCIPDTASRSGCHGWGTDSIEIVKAKSPVDTIYFGNNKTINTWWFAILQTDTVDLFIPPVFAVDIHSDHESAKDIALLCPNAGVRMFPAVSDTLHSGYSYLWTKGGEFISDLKNPLFFDLKDDTHLTLNVTDIKTGCVASGNYLVKVKDIIIPNLITPNADQKNDAFEILNLFPNTFVSIHNRWGDRVYETQDYHNDWGASAQDGVYYYLVDTKEKCGTFKGWVEVIR